MNKTYYLSNIQYHLCFRDSYRIELLGCFDSNIDSKFIPNIACINYQDSYGVGNPDTFLNLKDDALVADFVDTRRNNLGLSPSTVFLKMIDIAFGVCCQDCNSVAVFANYKWYTDKKTISYEYTLGDGTVIHRGSASIKNKCTESYIRHFIRTMNSNLYV